ncbi:MAG: thioesterase family protein [Flavobacteriales bacterium]|nr:thioesterase family protein [Flavobacteriales bacterium]
MLIHETTLRVRYAETDRMGYSYYGNYAIYFEVARVEALRSAGITYRILEDEGILLPVVEYNIRFIKPAYYDDELRIRTIIATMPSAKIHFDYETFRGDELLNRAWTDLVFVEKISGKPLRCPADVVSALQSFF